MPCRMAHANAHPPANSCGNLHPAIKYKNELRKIKNCVSVPQQFELVSSQHFFAHMGPSGVIPTFSVHHCLVLLIEQSCVL
jgi:hypothetical protein